MIYNILEVFTVTSDAGSFEAASKQLFVSATALSKQIKRLEEFTDLELFQRTNKGLTLTPSGKIFYDASKEMLRILYDAMQRGKDLERKPLKNIRLGISLINPYKYFSKEFHYNDHDFSRFTIAITPISYKYSTFTLQLRTLGQDVDIIPYFCGNKDFSDSCNEFCLAKLPMRIAIPVNHPLFGKDKLTLEDLKGEHIFTFNSNLNDYYKDINNDILAKQPDVMFHYSNHFDFNTFNFAVQNNYLILAADYLKEAHPLLKLHPVDWDYTLPYGLYYSKQPSDVVLSFIDSFKEYSTTGTVDDAPIVEF